MNKTQLLIGGFGLLILSKLSLVPPTSELQSVVGILQAMIGIVLMFIYMFAKD